MSATSVPQNSDSILRRLAVSPPARAILWLVRFFWQEHDRHLRAFDIVDYILYMIATWLFIAKAWPILISTPKLILPNAFIFAFVIIVFLRNYVVMHAIDNRHDGDDLQFVGLNLGWRYRLERILRALIVLVVITTPQGAFDWISGPIGEVSHGAQTLVSNIPLIASADEPAHPAIASFFSYYGTLMAFLFILFGAWDLTNISSISKGVRSGQIAWGEIVLDSTGSKTGVRYHDAVTTLMIYLNIAQRINGAGLVTYKAFFYTYDFGEKHSSQGKFLSMYARSFKMWERIMGLFVALSILFWVSSNCSLSGAIPLFLFSGSYFVIALQNHGYFRQMGRASLGFPLAEYIYAKNP